MSKVINVLKRSSYAFLLLLAAYAHASGSNAVQNFVDTWRKQNQIPAVTLAIKMANDKTDYYLSGSPIVDSNIKLNQNNLFGVGSITKTFIAATILQLQEAHKLNLDDPINKYLFQYPRWGTITVKQLLNMTSGIPNFTETATFNNLIQTEPTAYHSPDFFVNLAYQQKDLFKPGVGWSYSNTNYYLLGMIIEKICHHPLSIEFKQRFFKPLNLNHSYYSESTYHQEINQDRVHAYLNDKDVTSENPAYYGAAGGMVMNINDLVVWTQDLFMPGKILNKSSLKQFMTTLPIPIKPPKPQGSQYGLGIYSLNIKNYGLVWWYTGIINGYSSIIMWIPSKKMIIAAQINRFQEKNFGLLMPRQPFMTGILSLLSKDNFEPSSKEYP